MTVGGHTGARRRRALRGVRLDGEHGGLCGAYAARAGLEAVILQPEGAVARGKLAQARAVGAKVEMRANFEEALEEAKELEAAGNPCPRQLAQPLRLQGRRPPRSRSSRSWAVRPTSCAPVRRRRQPLRVRARLRRDRVAPTLRRRTGSEPCGNRASAIRIVEPAHEAEAQARADRVGRRGAVPSDEAILDAWRLLAHEEGLFCEPSSAAGLAALLADPPSGRESSASSPDTGSRIPTRSHEDPCARAGDDGEHRAGLRLCRGRARPLERARGGGRRRRGRRVTPRGAGVRPARARAGPSLRVRQLGSRASAASARARP
jgi:hypothetical protein